MSCAGVKKQFTAHSTRSASTSKAILSGIPLATIVKTAGWANAKTFEKLYHRKIKTNKQSFQQAIQNTNSRISVETVTVVR